MGNGNFLLYRNDQQSLGKENCPGILAKKYYQADTKIHLNDVSLPTKLSSSIMMSCVSWLKYVVALTVMLNAFREATKSLIKMAIRLAINLLKNDFVSF